MKTLLWVFIGIAIGIMAWVPLNLADRRDIPFGAAILAIVGSGAGGIIVLVAAVRWVRRGAATR